MFVNFQIQNVWHSKILLFKILTLIPKNLKFEKLANFPIYNNWWIWKIIKYSKFLIFLICRIFKI